MVEITPQKPILPTVAWRWPFWSSLALFFLVIGVFVGLKVYLSQVQKDLDGINEQIKAETAKASVKDETAILRLSDTLRSFNELVTRHTYFSQLLDFVDSHTHSKVIFTKFNANRESSALQLRGLTQNYTTLAKQIVALREDENIKSLEVKGINFTSKGLDFELLMTIDQKIFTK